MIYKPKIYLKSVPGTKEFVNLVRSYKMLEESRQDVLADVLEDAVEDSCKLLQDGLARFLLGSCKISGIFEPGCTYENASGFPAIVLCFVCIE